jgi:hypothetical protein
MARLEPGGRNSGFSPADAAGGRRWILVCRRDTQKRVFSGSFVLTPMAIVPKHFRSYQSIAPCATAAKQRTLYPAAKNHSVPPTEDTAAAAGKIVVRPAATIHSALTATLNVCADAYVLRYRRRRGRSLAKQRNVYPGARSTANRG